MTTTATATQLQTIATLWPDLHDALGTPATIAGFGLGLRGYLQALEQYDIAEVQAPHVQRLITTHDEHQRPHYRCTECDHVGEGRTHAVSDERNPDQLGTRPVPVNLRIMDTMRAVEAALHETATQIAAANQLSTSRPHPHRWYFTGRPRGAAWTAVWLSARAEGKFWPGRALTEAQHRHLSHVAAEALRRVETALDLATSTRELGPEHTCQCGGRITIRGGAGNQPTAHCRQCGALWTERGVVAA